MSNDTVHGGRGSGRRGGGRGRGGGRRSFGPSNRSELAAYLGEIYWAEDDLLRAIRADTARRGPSIEVTAEVGRLLAVLVRSCQARRVLEIGTLFGYSGVWMARQLPPGGSLDTIEVSSVHAEAAEHWFTEAGLDELVTVHRGRGLDVLPTLTGPYDLAFIDADKEPYPTYARLALERLRPGGLLVFDNVLRRGSVLDAGGGPEVQAIRELHTMLGASPHVVATTLQVGDGLAVAVKSGPS